MVGSSRATTKKESTSEKSAFKSRVCFVNRCTKVVAGGRRFSFSAVVVSGNSINKVGWGFAKSQSLSDAIKRAEKRSIDTAIEVPMLNGTIPFDTKGCKDSVSLMMKPMKPGKGIVAGPIPATILSMGGYKDILAKNTGGSNCINQVIAVFDALSSLKSEIDIRNKRIASKQASKIKE